MGVHASITISAGEFVTVNPSTSMLSSTSGIVAFHGQIPVDWTIIFSGREAAYTTHENRLVRLRMQQKVFFEKERDRRPCKHVALFEEWHLLPFFETFACRETRIRRSVDFSSSVKHDTRPTSDCRDSLLWKASVSSLIVESGNGACTATPDTRIQLNRLNQWHFVLCLCHDVGCVENS